MPIILHVEYQPKEGQQEQLLKAIGESVADVHAEDGCEKYAFHTTKDGRVVLIEVWRDKEALNAHAEGEPIKKIRAACADLLDAPATLTPIRPVPLGDPAKGAL